MNGARVLIVGCGRMGAVRAAAAVQVGARVEALVDAVPETAESLSLRYPGSRVIADPGDIDWDEFDAAFVCTPPGARGAELDAVRAGVPVLLEKPLGLSAEAGRALADEALARGSRTAVGYMNRYRPAVRDLRERLRRTPPFALACHWVVGPYAKPWWPDPAASGGPLNEQSTHLVDLCRFLAGEVDAVRALAGDGERDAARVDSVAVALQFRSGACGTLLYSFRARAKHIALDAFTPEGSERLEGWDFHRAGDLESDDPNAVFVTETAAFLGGGPVLSDVADAWRTQLVVDAIKAALTSDAPVEVAA
jgi:myo-inositol 2-dehydrogenase / D-chiro-inositol 1-dehydrogenase